MPDASSTPQEDAVCERLDWDTEFFGFPIGRVRRHALGEADAKAAEAWAAAHGVRCLYLQVDVNDMASIRQAEQHGYRLVDVKMTYEVTMNELRRLVPEERMPVLREAVAEDVPACRAMARGTYRQSRFYNDPGFTDEQCDELYATWIQRSIEGWADSVIALGPVGEPYGYMTCHQSGRMGISALREDRRGRGEGLALYQAGFDWFAARRIEPVLLVTQGPNLTSQRLFTKAGARLTNVSLWYHRWFQHP